MIFSGMITVETIFILGFTGLILAFYAFLRTVPRSKLSDRELPFISVVIPARNEEGKIARCLESLAKQNYPNYEILVIDDRSTDRTGDIIAEIAARYPHIKPLKGKENPDGWIGKCNALNEAVAHASGEWIVFTDADTCHFPNSLRDSVTYALSN